MLNVIEETKMSVEDFAQGLKIMPCLNCGTIGHLHLVLDFKVAATSQGKKIEEVGEATVCGACDLVFMSDTLIETLANKIEKVCNGSTNKYISVDKSNGQIVAHAIN